MRYIEIENGLDIISLHSSDIIEYLQIMKPTSIKWFEGGGTVLEYFVNLPNEYQIDDSYINSLDKDYNNNESKLIEDIRPLLNILEDGKYEINFHSGSIPSFFKAFKDKKGEPYWTLDICSKYTLVEEIINISQETEIILSRKTDVLFQSTDMVYEPMLIGTQPMSSINEVRVKYYKEKIQSGERPFAIIINAEDDPLSSCSPSYIIDGHHKLLAYKELNIFPHLVEITKQGGINNSIDTEYLLNNLYPWQIEHIIKTCDDKNSLFKESIINTQSKIHKYL